MRTYLVIALVCALGYGLVFMTLDKDSLQAPPATAATSLFPGLQGPLEATVLPRAEDFALNLDEHRRHDSNAVAVLLTDPDSSWFGLVSGLGSIGVPYRVVANVEEALAHDMIIVYPRLSGAVLEAAELQALAEHVRSGHTLVAFAVLGGGLNEVFGFTEVVESGLQRQLQFSEQALPRGFTAAPEERVLSFGSDADPESGVPALVYEQPKLPPLALYGDGRPAIVYNEYDTGEGRRKGRAVAMGVDLGHLLLRSHNARFTGLEGSYVNDYRPGGDSVLRLLVALYREANDSAVLLSPTPQGKDLAVLMTHDVDFTTSLANVPAYVAVEREAGIPATYFIQAKYVKDYNDDLFFDPARVEVLQQLTQWGMEVGSHSVSHSNEFRNMPLGDGLERYPDYQPFVQDFSTVRGASVSGELRVSRFLLQTFSGQPVRAFRPGHLSLPTALPQLLEATGYYYSSSMTANEAQTHLPFRSMYDRGYGAPVSVYEFPVSIEDEDGELLQRLDAALALSAGVASYHGLVTLLVHTESLGPKLEFVQRYVEALRDRAWFGTVSQYGDWWRVRESASLQWLETAGESRRLSVHVEGEVAGLTLELPPGWQLVSGPEGTVQNGLLLSLGSFSEVTEIVLQTNSAE
jgi:peptidoglycan/xylan/chitin deacetylase (PgdA/CDA1 family)